VFQYPREKPCEEVSLYDDNISHRPKVSKGQISTLSVRFTLCRGSKRPSRHRDGRFDAHRVTRVMGAMT